VDKWNCSGCLVHSCSDSSMDNCSINGDDDEEESNHDLVHHLSSSSRGRCQDLAEVYTSSSSNGLPLLWEPNNNHRTVESLSPSRVTEEDEGVQTLPTMTSVPPIASTPRSRRGPPRLAFLRANMLSPKYLFRSECTENTRTLELDDQEAQIRRSLLLGSISPRNEQHGDYEDNNDSTSHNGCGWIVRRLELFRDEQIPALWQFVRPFGNYLGYCTLLTMTIMVPTVLYHALKSRKVETAAYRSAAVMVIGTVILSARLVYLHLTHWYMPQVQKYVVRILFMVPIYAVQSYLSIVFHQNRVYMSTIRDFYEAFVIASFVYYLMELLGGQEPLTRLLATKSASFGQHIFPLNLVLKPWEMGIEFLLNCKHGALQYVVFKTVATVLTIVCEACGVLKEGSFTFTNAYGYLAFFQNMSVMYALYCLAVFFHAVSEELREPIDWRPLGKFLCIKGVVFFTWWQGVLIFSLKEHGFIDSMGSWSSVQVANGLIDYCIVVEMVLFAIAHSYTFTYTEYLPGRYSHVSEGHTSRYSPPAILHQRMGFRAALWSSTVPRETLHDIRTLQRETLDDIRILRSGMIDRRFRRRINSSGDVVPDPSSELDDNGIPTVNELDRDQTMT
jgi:Organic solute transporter Ostalpha